MQKESDNKSDNKSDINDKLILPEFPPIKHDLQTRFGSEYGEEEKKAMLEVLERDAPTSNIKTVEFEKEFAKYCGTKYAITVSNGTAALEMAYKAIGIGYGDEVITTPITWIATAAAAVTLGAKIRFADINPNTFNIEPDSIKKLINDKTKAICPVHLYGQPVDMKPIMEIAADNNIMVIEDSAHAPGGKYHGKSTGNIGHIGCFSFHEQKNMSTLGEGGMITTNDPELYEKARSYKSHCARVVGPSSKYLSFSNQLANQYLNKKQYWFQDFDDCGYNFRMNDITAAVGIIQLHKLDKMNQIRISLAKYLDENIAKLRNNTNFPIKPLDVIDDVVHTYHLYPILFEQSKSKLTREELIYNLRMKHGIKVGVHYMPLVQSTAFKKRGFKESDTPIAVKSWPSLITLPIHPRLTNDDLDYLMHALKEELL